MSASEGSGREGSRRVQRVEREVREVLSQYIIRNLRGELSGLTTVTTVRLTADLKLAKVYISVMGTPEEIKLNFEILNDEVSEMQHELGKTLRLKFCPKLRIFPDDVIEQSLHVQKVLKELKTDRPSIDGVSVVNDAEGTASLDSDDDAINEE